MPSRPPGLKAKPKRPAFHRPRDKTTTDRGYGWKHQQMRERVLREEPLCRSCLAMDPPRYTPSYYADHIIPVAEGGTDDRENYQALGLPLSKYPNGCDCHDRKTQAEAKRATTRSRSSPRPKT